MEAVKKPTAGKKNRSEWTITLLTPAERKRVDQAAEKEDLSVSAFVRRAVLRDLARGSGLIKEDWPEAAGR